MHKLLHTIFLTVLVAFPSCKICGDYEKCLCSTIELVTLEFDFNSSSQNGFPSSLNEPFVLYPVDNLNNPLNPGVGLGFINQLENTKQYHLFYDGEAFYFDYEKAPLIHNLGYTYFIKCDAMQFIDTISDLYFEYKAIPCSTPEWPKRCIDNECMEIDFSTLSLKYNGVEYCYDDLPIKVNYYGPEY